jgi:hypothetical protein
MLLKVMLNLGLKLDASPRAIAMLWLIRLLELAGPYIHRNIKTGITRKETC